MSDIATYNGLNNPIKEVSYAKVNSTAEQIAAFSKSLHSFLPVLEAEFKDLEALNQKRPNEIFPIKMSALAAIYQAAKPLYEWYVEKAKNRI